MSWASNISPGDPSEVGFQTVSFNVTVNATSPMPIDLASVAVSNVTGTLQFDVLSSVYGVVTGSVQICDNLGLCSLTTCPFAINVEFVNTPPTFTLLATSAAVNESSSLVPTSIANVATITSLGSGTAVLYIVTVASSTVSGSLFAVAPAIDVTGTLTFTAATDTYGSATLQVALQNNAGTANGGIDTSAPSFIQVTVLYINRAPTMTVMQSTYSIPEDSGPQSVSTLFSNISPGPTSESWQTVSFNIVNITYSNVWAPLVSDNSLFAVLPVISPSGVLTFTANTYAYGTAIVSYRLQDNGGYTQK
jgi:hypothetical protein